MLKNFAAVLVAFFSAPSFAEITQNCGDIQTPPAYKYCLTQDTESASTDVLYYLHGGGGSEKSWITNFPALYDAWKARKIAAPKVITISFGPGWILTQKNTAPNSGLLELFKDSIVPKMEELALGQPAKRRFVLGPSMGGFNSIQLLAHYPGLFDRAVILCPAVLNISPFAPRQEIEDYLKSIGQPATGLDSVLALVKAFVDTESTWNETVSPVAIVKKSAKTFSPSLIATNKKDIYWGPGGESFAQLALQAGANAKVESWPGSHCKINKANMAKIARFLKP